MATTTDNQQSTNPFDNEDIFGSPTTATSADEEADIFGGSGVMDTIQSNEQKRVKKLVKGVEEIDPFSAFDALQSLDLQIDMAVENGSTPKGEGELAARAIEQAKSGDLKGTVDALIAFDNDKTIDVAKKQVLDIANKPGDMDDADRQTIKQYDNVVGEFSQPPSKGEELGQVDPTDLIMRRGKVGRGRDSHWVSDYFFDSVSLGKMNRSQREKANQAATQMALMAQGYDLEQIEQLYKDASSKAGTVEQSIYDPVDILVDFSTGGVRHLLSAGIKKLSGKAAAKMAASEAAYGAVAGGFMTYADYKNGGALSTLIAGVAGPVVANSIFLASRKGLATWFSSLKTSNETMYRDIRAAVDKAKGSSEGATNKVKEILDEIDAGNLTLTGERVNVLGKSPGAMTATYAAENADVSATRKLTETALSALADDSDPQVKELAKKALGTSDTGQWDIIPFVRDETNLHLLEGHSEMATSFRNTFDIQDTIAHQFFHDVQTSNDSLFPDLVRQRFNLDENSVQFGHGLDIAEEAFMTGKMGTTAKTVLQPSMYFGDMADLSVKIPSSLASFQRSMVKSGQEILDKHIYHKLSKAENKQLDNLFRMGTDVEETFKVGKGGLYSEKTGEVYHASDKLIERYYKGRYLMDSLWGEANKVEGAVKRQQGFKQLDDGFVARPVTNKIGEGQADIDGKTWTKGMKNEGWTAVEIYDPTLREAKTGRFKFLNPQESTTRLKEIQDGLELLPRLEGYSPLKYQAKESKFFITKVVRGKDGEYSIEKVAASGNYTKAAETVTALRQANKRTEEGEVNYFAHRSSDDVDFAMDKMFASNVRKLDHKELALLASGMREGGIDEDTIDAIMRYSKTFAQNKKQPFRKRGARRLRDVTSLKKALKDSDGDIEAAIEKSADAPLEPTKAAMASYIDNVTKFINMSAADDRSKTAFMKKYGGPLGMQNWQDEINLSRFAKRGSLQKLALEATEVQAQMKRITGIPTNKELLVQGAWENRADKFYASEKGKHVGTFIDNYLTTGRFGAYTVLRKIGAITKLGLFSLDQFLVQQTSILNNFKYASTPEVLSDGFLDFNAVYLKAIMGSKLGIKASDKDMYKYDLLKRSGINAEVNFEYVNRIIKESAGSSGWLSAPKKAVSKGFVAMREGEAAARAMIWFTERRKLMDEIKKGTEKRLKNGDIDSDAFIARVNSRTLDSAGDFSKYNQAMVSRKGVVSAITQFWQYPIFQASFMSPFNKSMSPAQKAGVWGAWIGAFGLNGVPGFWTAAAIGEHALGGPEDTGKTKEVINSYTQATMKGLKASKRLTEFVQRQVTDGAVASTTGGRVNFATRAGIAHVADNFIGGLSYQDLMGPGLSTVVGIATGSLETVSDLYGLWQSDEFDRIPVTKVLTSQTGALSEVRSVSNALKATLPEINNREDADFFDRLQQFTGLKPGIDVAIAERKWDIIKSSQRLKEFSWSEAKRVAGLLDDSPKYAGEEIARVAQRLMEINPEEASRFMRAVTTHWQSLHLPPDLQLEFLHLKEMQDSSIYPTIPKGGN